MKGPLQKSEFFPKSCTVAPKKLEGEPFGREKAFFIRKYQKPKGNFLKIEHFRKK